MANPTNWSKKKVTKKQREFLHELGCEDVSGLNKLTASRLIDNLLAKDPKAKRKHEKKKRVKSRTNSKRVSRPNAKITVKQKQFLRELGCDDCDGLSRQEASTLIDKMLDRKKSGIVARSFRYLWRKVFRGK